MAMVCLCSLMATGYFLACWREIRSSGSKEEDGVDRETNEFKLWLCFDPGVRKGAATRWLNPTLMTARKLLHYLMIRLMIPPPLVS